MTIDEPLIDHAVSEREFAERVDRLGATPLGRVELVGLLQETHPAYDERGMAATVRMRGWVLETLGRDGLPDCALLYVLEELDTGRDPYLVAAAARALRGCPRREPGFAPYLARAITNVRDHDDFVSFASYGVYVDDREGTSAFSEVLATLRWLGPAARGVVTDLELLVEEHRRGELPASRLEEVTNTITAIQCRDRRQQGETECCTMPWEIGRRFTEQESRRKSTAIESTVFEDHDGRSIGFAEFFRGKPSVVVFFYTRCDNPRKCSLSIAKLASLQRSIADLGMAGQVRTAAITYDPAWDQPERLRGYAVGRGVRLSADNRMLRSSLEDLSVIRRHFGLGVNYVESLVNRHRVEAFVLDADGRVAATFERLQWDEASVAERLKDVIAESVQAKPRAAFPTATQAIGRGPILSIAAPIASLAAAFFPRCPVCLAAYLSLSGIVGLERLAGAPWVVPALFSVMALNLASLWVRGRSTGRMVAFRFAVAGAFAIAVLGLLFSVTEARTLGVCLTIGASLLSATDDPRKRLLE